MWDPEKRPLMLKVIACEIALREISYLASQSPNLADFDFLTQGHHDEPAGGHKAVQEHIDAVPSGKYDAILLGYGLCSNILAGVTARHTRLVIPRAHDCITFFLGSKERYQEQFSTNPGTFYYTAGWLECRQRRGLPEGQDAFFLPATATAAMGRSFEEMVKKYGEEEARYLLEVMQGWTSGYSCGTLIDYDFTKPLRLDDQVKKICDDRGWRFENLPGDLNLLRRWINGEWDSRDFLVVEPGQEIIPTHDDAILGVKPAG